MNETNEKKITSLDLDEKLYTYLENLAKQQNTSIARYIETVLIDATNFKIPNEETKFAIEEFKKEKPDLKGYTDIDKLFDDLSLN
ncbi:hypothetical protein [Sphingobacterium hungaricum]